MNDTQQQYWWCWWWRWQSVSVYIFHSFPSESTAINIFTQKCVFCAMIMKIYYNKQKENILAKRHSLLALAIQCYSNVWVSSRDVFVGDKNNTLNVSRLLSLSLSIYLNDKWNWKCSTEIARELLKHWKWKRKLAHTHPCKVYLCTKESFVSIFSV